VNKTHQPSPIHFTGVNVQSLVPAVPLGAQNAQ
jgi:hypothetical protein